MDAKGNPADTLKVCIFKFGFTGAVLCGLGGSAPGGGVRLTADTPENLILRLTNGVAVTFAMDADGFHASSSNGLLDIHVPVPREEDRGDTFSPDSDLCDVIWNWAGDMEDRRAFIMAGLMASGTLPKDMTERGEEDE